MVDLKVVDASGTHYSIDQGSLRNPERAKQNAEDATASDTATPAQKDDTEEATVSMGLGEQETFDQFINFLTYRSAGNPKKLKELIQSMIQTSSHAFALSRYPYTVSYTHLTLPTILLV